MTLGVGNSQFLKSVRNAHPSLPRLRKHPRSATGNSSQLDSCTLTRSVSAQVVSLHVALIAPVQRSSVRHGLTSPRTYRCNHRQPSLFQSRPLFSRRETMEIKEPTTCPRHNPVHLRIRTGTLARSRQRPGRDLILRPLRQVPRYCLVEQTHTFLFSAQEL